MFRHSVHLLAVLILMLAGPATRPAAAQQAPDLQASLSRPLSPGTVADLVNYPTEQAALARLEEALRHSRSDVRAAAARVIFVTGARELTLAATEALKAESDAGAAMEEARVVAYFVDDDQPLLDAWKRLGVDAGASVLFALVGAHGMPSLRLIPQIRDDGATENTIAAFIRLATRGKPDAMLAVASNALEQRDSALFAAVLTSTYNAPEMTPPFIDALATKGLAPGAVRDVVFKTIWFVLQTWPADRPLSEGLRRGLEQAIDAGYTPVNSTELFGLEIAARVVGRPPGAPPGWNELMTTPPAAIRRLVSGDAVRTMLTPGELEAIQKGLTIAPDGSRPSGSITRSTAGPAGLQMRTASDYPFGFMADVFKVAGCNVADAKKVAPGEAVLTFRLDGRARRVELAESNGPRGCADAVRVLMMTHVEPVGQIAPEQARLLIPFDTDFIMCQDSPTSGPLDIEGSDRRIQQPRRTRHIPPVYPQSAIDQRIQGVVVVEAVISPTGCVPRARIVRSVDPRLDGAALAAVTGWRYTPTLLGNTPVPVIMTVTVQFSLN